MQYSPESFTQTELAFAYAICEKVHSPNVFADRVEYFHQGLSHRKNVNLSVHCHNDRGTAVAASELAILAGADRVEGTLFGNGERTGDADLITLVGNFLSQGIDPGINISNLPKVVEIYRGTVQLTINPRHPYAGERVFTTFPGTHQDAIYKTLKVDQDIWDVPYLPIDPKDVGRDYSQLIQINAQSGKGGVAYVIENETGIKLSKLESRELADKVQVFAEKKGGLVTSKEIIDLHKHLMKA